MRREVGISTAFVCCISAGRPRAVERTEAFFGPMTWFTPRAEADAYRESGATKVLLGSENSVAYARNRALEAAFETGVPCLMLDDDCTGTAQQIVWQHGQKAVHPIRPWDALEALVGAMEHNDLRLGALTHLTNPFYVTTRRSYTATINGGCLLVKPCPLRFDTNLRTNSDVDYGIQHMKEYGGALRLNEIILAFRRGNKGDGTGMSRYRTDDQRRADVDYLVQKWPGIVKRDRKRPEHPKVRFR